MLEALLADDALADARTGRDRRTATRHGQDRLQWLRVARLQFGQGVSIIDLSTGGARIDSPVALGPSLVSALEMFGTGFEAVVPFRVLRCEVGGLSPNGVIYRGACEFIRPIELPDIVEPRAPVAELEDVLELDVVLKQLARRACAEDAATRFSDGQILQALRALRLRAANVLSDPMGQRLNALLRLVIPAIEQGRGLPALLEHIEAQLQRVVPAARVRFSGTQNGATLAGRNAIVIGATDLAGSGPLVNIDLPKRLALTQWQSRVVRAMGRVIAVLQRLEPAASLAVNSPAIEPATLAPRLTIVPPIRTAEEAPAKPAAAIPPTPAPATPQPVDGIVPAGWQKVVVRYTEGESLKGYTQDFHASRPHFTLSSAVSAVDVDSVIVPLVRLKAVFFVRDFAGNPSYVERTDVAVEPERGRRIEVTLNDEEVIVGTTLNYRSDGQGFFVTPIDPEANNIRVFVVANSVRQVRFPATVRLQPAE